MFIPISFANLIEDSNAIVLGACLQPFITELENLFENRFWTLFP